MSKEEKDIRLIRLHKDKIERLKEQIKANEKAIKKFEKYIKQCKNQIAYATREYHRLEDGVGIDDTVRTKDGIGKMVMTEYWGEERIPHFFVEYDWSPRRHVYTKEEILEVL